MIDYRIPSTMNDDVQTLYVREQSGAYRLATENEILACADHLLAAKLPGTEVLNSPDSVELFLRVRMGLLEHEAFSVVLLNSQNVVLAYAELFRGTLTQTAVYPREVLKLALSANAAALIVVHNHPSGLAEPSTADRMLTDALRAALRVIDVTLLDHLIVTPATVFSFARAGLL